MSSVRKSIGGFFALETINNSNTSEYYSKLYSFNTARSILELIIIERKIKHLFLPSYYCDVVLEAFNNTNCTYSFYELNEKLELANENMFKSNSHILYINYFGIKNKYIYNLTKYYPNCIIDNSQAFFDKPIKNIDTFYSPRKYFGVPDGSYLSTNIQVGIAKYEVANSNNRISHLLIRKEFGPEKAYNKFVKNEEKLNDLPIQQMSAYTKNILSSIDYNSIIEKRKNNFKIYHIELGNVNDLYLDLNEDTVPMCYPLYIENGNKLRNYLIKNKVYIPRYWPNLEKHYNNFENLELLVENIVALPIDHRYNKNDIDIVIRLIKEFLI